MREEQFEILTCYHPDCGKKLGVRTSSNFTAHAVPGLQCIECFYEKYLQEKKDED